MCRVQRGLSQEQVATKAGLSVSYLSLIEQNKRDPPMSTLEAVARALEVPMSILVFLGADPDELKGISEELRDKLASAALQIMRD